MAGFIKEIGTVGIEIKDGNHLLMDPFTLENLKITRFKDTVASIILMVMFT